MNNLSLIEFLDKFKYPENYEMSNVLVGLEYANTIENLTKDGYTVFKKEQDLYDYLSKETVKGIVIDPVNDFLKADNLSDLYFVLPHRTNFSFWFGLTLERLKDLAIVIEKNNDAHNSYAFYLISTNTMSIMEKGVLYRFIWNKCINLVLQKLLNYTPYKLYVSENKKYGMKEIFIEDEYYKLKNLDDLHIYLEKYKKELFDIETGNILNPITIENDKIELILKNITAIFYQKVFLKEYYESYDYSIQFREIECTIRYNSTIDNNLNLVITPFKSDLQILIDRQIGNCDTDIFQNYLFIDEKYEGLFETARKKDFELLDFGKVVKIIKKEKALALYNEYYNIQMQNYSDYDGPFENYNPINGLPENLTIKHNNIIAVEFKQ